MGMSVGMGSTAVEGTRALVLGQNLQTVDQKEQIEAVKCLSPLGSSGQTAS